MRVLEKPDNRPANTSDEYLPCRTVGLVPRSQCPRGIVTLVRVHDDSELDEELADQPDDDEATVEDENAHTLSIRRANGEEVLTIFSPNEEWSVYLQPGGGITNALIGSPSDPIVWVNAIDRPVERDEDGTYVVRVD
jgi:hypothetical protein